MGNNRPFSKLKKTIEELFDSDLKMEFCCNSFPLRNSWNPTNAIPRFYVKLDKQLIWDYPKQFEVKNLNYGYWADNNHISELVREYIDTPVQILFTKHFENEIQEYQTYETDSKTVTVNYHLTELFIAADRRLGKEKLLEWAKTKNNPMVDLIVSKRFYTI